MAIVATSLFAASPASAEVGAALSVFSDARFRGLSISDDHPVALIDLTYDDPEGMYLAASGIAVASSHGLRPLSLKLNGGYAKRLSSGVTLDTGVVHSRYSRYSSAVSARSYTEVYAGAAWKSIAARLYFSPRYFETESSTLYGELEDSLNLAPKLRLNGHVGLLVPLHGRNGIEPRPSYDWRIAVSRQFGRLSAHGSWTGRGRVRRYEGAYLRPTNGLVFGVICAL